MILHRLEVGGFRCFTSRVALAPDPEQINILHGRNGSGKSSLLWALIRGLLDTHRAGGKSVEALRPWGTDLGPTIVVEFEDQGKRYRLEKNFLENRCARLAEVQGAKLKPLAQNEKAEERVREILLSETPTVGLTKPDKWGLARALWCPQEHLLVDGFDGRVLGSIQELLGKHAMNEEALALENKVEKLYLEYWTPQGKPKGGKDAAVWVRRQAELAKPEESLSECAQELEELHAAQETAKVLYEEREITRNRFEQSQGAMAELQTRVAVYTPLVEKCGKLDAQYRAKQAEAGALDAVIRQVADLREKEEKTHTRLGELDEKIRASKEEESKLDNPVRDAAELLKSFEAGDPQVNSLRKLQADADKYLAGRQQLGGLQSRLQQIALAEEVILKHTDELKGLGAPDDATLSALDQLATKRVQLQTQLDGALLHVQLTPDAGRRIEVLQGSPSGSHQAAAGGDVRVSGSPAVELVLEAFGRIRVTGPPSSASEIEKKLAHANSQIQEITARFGSDDLAELKSRRQRAVVLDTEIAGAKKSRQHLLEGQMTEALKAATELLEQEVLGIEKQQAGWKDNPPDAAEIRQQLEAANLAFEQHRTEATEEWKKRQQKLGAVRGARSANEREREQLSTQSIENLEKLSRLRADGLSDADRLKGFQTLALESVGLEQQYKGEAARLKKMGEDPRPLLQEAEKQQGVAQQAFEKCDRALHEHRGTLKKLLDRAPYERCARLEEEIGEIHAEIDRDKLRADALKLIRETIAECEEEATAGVAGPIAERASKILRRIVGTRMKSINLSDELAPWAVELTEAEDAVDLEHLSGGEREQVYIAVRLALAELLTKDAGRRELVVLDDVLTFTDDERLKRVLTILDEMRPHAQFLILTCHPERYKPLKGANFIDLEKLRG
jgi:DNA repair exonuclease SbcCD ATPase subunit